MINLLPDNNKKLIEREYALRRLAVALFLIFLTTIFIAAFLAPTYVLVWYKHKGVESESSNIAKNRMTDEELKNKLNDAAALIKALKIEQTVLPSDIIALIIKDKADNTITNLSYARGTSTTPTMIIQGIAKTRKSLATFTETLAHERGIQKVDVPVSNYAKDGNSEFSFTITAGK